MSITAEQRLKRDLLAQEMYRGIGVISDPTVPPGEAHFRDRKGRLLTKIVNVAQRDPLDELARLKDQPPSNWTSWARDELLGQFLIEATYEEDGRWAGDQITLKGLRALAQRGGPG